jgi:hypothetical protein
MPNVILVKVEILLISASYEEISDRTVGEMDFVMYNHHQLA